jgi:AraC-like DNA-binding protein
VVELPATHFRIFENMKYQEFTPSANLRAMVKCFYLCEYDTDIVVHDTAFATGSMEIMFNLGKGSFQTRRENKFVTTPRIELWGQVITPLDFRSLGKNKILGVRFYPHTAHAVLGCRVDVFNDHVIDLSTVLGSQVQLLHEQLLNAATLHQQISFLESFLLRKQEVFQEKNKKFQLVNSVICEMRGEDFCNDIQSVAFRYGISSRYLQKLFLEFTGLAPKLYYKIIRFQKSMVLTGKDHSLTEIAYQSGYFDQSHFIRDFKLFTGVPPSLFDVRNSSAILASPNR